VNALGARRNRTESDVWLPNFILVNDPSAVKRVLVDNAANFPKTKFERQGLAALFRTGLLGAHGAQWRARRRMIAPAFQPGSVAAYVPAIAATCEALGERLNELDGQSIDVIEGMSLLALRTSVSTMLSSHSDHIVRLVGCALREALSAMHGTLLSKLPVIGSARELERAARMQRAFVPLDALIERLVAERQGQPEPETADMLAWLIAARDDNGAGLSPSEIRDEIVTIFVAGWESTAATMSWIWYLLARHPRVEALLFAELERVLGARVPGEGDLQALSYTRQVVEETLRLYPPATELAARACLTDDDLGICKVPRGASIAIVPFVLHRHSQLWDNPERFDPDRFSGERKAGRHRFAYLPFGAGPRNCIGQMLAINQLVLMLATLARTHRLRLAQKARVGFVQGVTLRPSGLQMVVERRTRSDFT
jgi:cytochrome P450